MADVYEDLISGVPVVLPVFDKELTSYAGAVAGNGSKTFTVISKYRQQLNGIELKFQLIGNAVASGGGSTRFTLSLPPGMVIDWNALLDTTPGSNANDEGFGYEYNITAAAYTVLSGVIPQSGNTIAFFRNGGDYLTSTNLNSSSTCIITGQVWLPIVGLSSHRAYGAGKATAQTPGLVGPRKGQFDLVITGTGWTTIRSKAVYYQDQDGNHRMKFNISGNQSSAARNQLTLAMTGVAAIGQYQAAAAYSELASVAVPTTALVQTGLIIIYHASGANSFYCVSGDVELASKPSWA